MHDDQTGAVQLRCLICGLHHDRLTYSENYLRGVVYGDEPVPAALILLTARLVTN